MNFDEFEAEALKLEPAARARLATRLLASLETLSDEENLQLWMAEAERRDGGWEAGGQTGDPAEQVFQEARAALHRALRESDVDVAEGRLVDADQVLKDLRSRLNTRPSP